MTREPPIDTVIRHLMNAGEIACRKRMGAALRRAANNALHHAWAEKDRQRARDRARGSRKK